jgi:endogenous inhibitor of DNA gyrase (YacG/DUF329 family)
VSVKGTMVNGYAGFVCGECGVPVNEKLQGAHVPGCSKELHNDGLEPWREEDDESLSR